MVGEAFLQAGDDDQDEIGIVEPAQTLHGQDATAFEARNDPRDAPPARTARIAWKPRRQGEENGSTACLPIRRHLSAHHTFGTSHKKRSSLCLGRTPSRFPYFF